MVHNIVVRLGLYVWCYKYKHNSRAVFWGRFRRFNTGLGLTYGSRQIRLDAAPCKFAKLVKHRIQHFRIHRTYTAPKTTPINGSKLKHKHYRFLIQTVLRSGMDERRTGESNGRPCSRKRRYQDYGQISAVVVILHNHCWAHAALLTTIFGRQVNPKYVADAHGDSASHLS